MQFEKVIDIKGLSSELEITETEMLDLLRKFTIQSTPVQSVPQKLPHDGFASKASKDLAYHHGKRYEELVNLIDHTTLLKGNKIRAKHPNGAPKVYIEDVEKIVGKRVQTLAPVTPIPAPIQVPEPIPVIPTISIEEVL